MRDLRILVTSAGGPSFPGALKGLKENGERSIDVIAVDASPESSGGRMPDVEKFYTVPLAKDRYYLDELFKIVDKEKIDAIIPLSTAESIVLSENQDHVPVMVSDSPQIKDVTDKYWLYSKIHQELGIQPIAHARTDFRHLPEYIKALGYPDKILCVKPINGEGTRGFYILDNHADTIVQYYQSKHVNRMTYAQFMVLFPGRSQQILLMEYIEGIEYSVDVLIKDCNVIATRIRRRDKVVNGVSIIGTIIDRPDIHEMSIRLAEHFKLNFCVGIQFIESLGNLYLLEINPRLQSGVTLAIEAGVNFPYLGLKILLKEPFEYYDFNSSIRIFDGLKMYRYWKDAYVPR
jgi:carbamoyl-phosphate synthase large subunit